MVDRFANGDPNNDINVEPSVPGKYPRRRLAGRDRHLDYLQDARRHRAVDLAGREERRGGRRVRQLPRLLDAGLPAAERALRRPRRSCASSSTRRTRSGMLVILDVVTNHMGQLFYYDINGNGQPDDTLVRRRLLAHVPADLHAEPAAVHGRRADVLRAGQGLPRAHHRVGSRLRPARRAGLDLARLLGPGRRPVHRLARVRTARRRRARRSGSAGPTTSRGSTTRAGTTGAAASTCGGTRPTTRRTSCASRRPRATSRAASRISTPTTPTSRRR